MTEENVGNGEVFDDAVEIEGEEDSDAALKTAPLTQKIATLELENNQLVHENQVIKERLEKLKHSNEVILNENVDLQKKADKFESENRALESVAARAAELEAEHSRLQHHFITSMNHLEESSSELSKLMSTLERLKATVGDKDVTLDATLGERNLLLLKLEKLQASANDQRAEVEGKEKEIRGLKNQIEDLEATVMNIEAWKKEKEALHVVNHGLEKRVTEMMGKVAKLEKKLEEKERLITERAVDSNVNGIPATKDKVGSLVVKVDLPVVAAASVAAAAVVGILCYLRYGRKP